MSLVTIVKMIHGVVKVKSANGQERILNGGEIISSGDIIQTGNDSSVDFDYQGNNVHLPSNEILLLIADRGDLVNSVDPTESLVKKESVDKIIKSLEETKEDNDLEEKSEDFESSSSSNDFIRISRLADMSDNRQLVFGNNEPSVLGDEQVGGRGFEFLDLSEYENNEILIPVPIIQDGQNSISIVSGFDNYINESESLSVRINGSIRSDFTLIEVSIVDGGGNSITYSVSNQDVTVINGIYTISNIDLKDLNFIDGYIEVIAVIRDSNGVDSEIKDNAILDTVAPVVTLIEVLQNGTGVSISGSVSDANTVQSITVNVVGVDHVVTQINADGTWVLNINNIFNAPGDYEITARAVDIAGNESDASGSSVILPVDFYPPSPITNFIEIDSGSDSYLNFSESNDVQISLTLEPGITVTSISIVGYDSNGNTKSEIISVSMVNGVYVIPKFNLKSLGFSDGDISANAIVKNIYGKELEISDSAILDTTPPSVAVHSVSQNGKDLIILVSSNDGDGSGVNGVTIKIENEDFNYSNNEYVAVLQQDGFWRIELTDFLRITGEHKINAKASDNSGNNSDYLSIPYDFYVDIDPPDSSPNYIEIFTSPDQYINNLEKSSVTILGEIEDGASLVKITINGSGDEIDVSGLAIGTHTLPSGVIFTLNTNNTYTLSNIDFSNIPDGEVTVTATIRDAVGNIGFVSDNAQLDSVGPELTNIEMKQNGSVWEIEGFSNEPATITITANNAVTITVTTETTAQADGSYKWTASVNSVVHGVNNIEFTAIDRAGNSEPHDEVFSPAGDRIPPGAPGDIQNTITIDSGSDEYLNLSEVSNVTIRGKVEVPNGVKAELLSLTISGNGAPDIIITGSALQAVKDSITENGEYAINENLSVFSDGVITVTASIKDAAGNVGDVRDSAQLDKTPPAINITTMEQKGSYWEVIGTAEAGASIKVMVNSGAELTTTALPDGTWKIYAYSSVVIGPNSFVASATDIAGNTAYDNDSATGVSYDDVNSIRIESGNDDYINAAEAGSVTISGKLQSGNTLLGISISNGNSSELIEYLPGNILVKIESSGDVAGSYNFNSVGSYRLDDGVIYTIDADGEYTFSNINLSYLSDGNLVVFADIKDGVGNSISGVEDEVLLDKTAPVLSNVEIKQNGNIWYISGDSSEAFSSITVVINGSVRTASAGSNGKWSLSSVPYYVVNGNNTFLVSAKDLAGNKSIELLREISSDLTPPYNGDGNNFILIESGDDEYLNKNEINSKVTISGKKEANSDLLGITITGINGASISYVLSGGYLVNSNGNNGTFSWKNPPDEFEISDIDLSLFSNGLLTIEATIKDAAGNVGTVSDTATIDIIAPELTISSNLAHLSAGQSAIITFSFTDNVVGFGNASVLVTGGTLGSLTKNPSSNVWTGIFTASGNAPISISVSDALVFDQAKNSLISNTLTINSNPVVSNSSLTIDEDSTMSGGNVFKDQDNADLGSDINGNQLSVTGFKIAGTSYSVGDFAYLSAGDLRISENGDYVFTPKPNWSGSLDVRLFISDGVGGTSESTLNINVIAVADEPILEIASDHVVPDAAYVGKFRINAINDTSQSYPIYSDSMSYKNVGNAPTVGMTGMIYLQAGEQYTFLSSVGFANGYSLAIGGTTIGTVQPSLTGFLSGLLGSLLSAGKYISVPYTATYTGYHYIEYSVKDNVIGGTFETDLALYNPTTAISQVVNSTLFDVVASKEQLDQALDEGYRYDQNGKLIKLDTNEGYSGKKIYLPAISSSLTDVDGSESLSILVSGAPAGSIISDGVRSAVFNGSSTINIAGWNLNSLSIKSDISYSGSFTLNFSAVATESSNGSSSSVSDVIDINVIPSLNVTSQTVSASSAVSDVWGAVFSGSSKAFFVANYSSSVSKSVSAPLSRGLQISSSAESTSPYLLSVGDVYQIRWEEYRSANWNAMVMNAEVIRSYRDGTDIVIFKEIGGSRVFVIDNGSIYTTDSYSTLAQGSDQTVGFSYISFSGISQANKTVIAYDAAGNSIGSTLANAEGAWSLSNLKVFGATGVVRFEHALAQGFESISYNYRIGSDVADTITGTSSSDLIIGANGNDTIRGGAGSDVLTGGAGADTFVWRLGDQGSASAPAMDRITDFNLGQGDVLDLRDLLQGENRNNLDQYLNFQKIGSDTIVNVKHTGGHAVTQTIRLENVDLTALGDSDRQILDSLLNNNHLRIDQ